MTQDLTTRNQTTAVATPQGALTLPRSLGTMLSTLELDFKNQLTLPPPEFDRSIVLSKVEEFEAALVPATHGEIEFWLRMLAAGKAVKGASDLDADDLKMKYEQYYAVWGGKTDKHHGIPAGMLKDACENWIVRKTFFPGVEEIVAAVDVRLTNRLSVLRKLKALANYETIEAPKKSDLTKEQREALTAPHRILKDMSDD